PVATIIKVARQIPTCTTVFLLIDMFSLSMQLFGLTLAVSLTSEHVTLKPLDKTKNNLDIIINIYL
ncbi:MAG TPA: hypothetical protein QF529_05720, partial [Candidatus Thalassarchaeaceae archaeon]|nr:hypothetical protein [Candidatus Thalassarchaeaceae archaeon]